MHCRRVCAARAGAARGGGGGLAAAGGAAGGGVLRGVPGAAGLGAGGARRPPAVPARRAHGGRARARTPLRGRGPPPAYNRACTATGIL